MKSLRVACHLQSWRSTSPTIASAMDGEGSSGMPGGSPIIRSMMRCATSDWVFLLRQAEEIRKIAFQESQDVQDRLCLQIAPVDGVTAPS